MIIYVFIFSIIVITLNNLFINSNLFSLKFVITTFFYSFFVV